MDVVVASRGHDVHGKVSSSFLKRCLWSRRTRSPGLSHHFHHAADDRDGAHEPDLEQDHDLALHDAESKYCVQHQWRCRGTWAPPWSEIGQWRGEGRRNRFRLKCVRSSATHRAYRDN